MVYNWHFEFLVAEDLIKICSSMKLRYSERLREIARRVRQGDS